MWISKISNRAEHDMKTILSVYKLIETFESVDEILKCDHSHESYYIKQYFPVVLFILLNKVVLTLESVDEILKCDNSHESY